MSTRRPRIFITRPVAERALRRLEPRADVLGNSDPLRVLTKPELIAAVRDVDYLFGREGRSP